MRKKVDFVTLGGSGRRAKTVRSRTTDWLCPGCLAKDPAWNLEKYNTPGMQSEALNRVRAAQERENGNGGSAGPGTQATEVPAECQGTTGSQYAGNVPVAVYDSGS